MSLENLHRRLNAAGIDTSIEGLIARERARSKNGEPGPFEIQHRAFQKRVQERLEEQKKKQTGCSK
jgi:hypothetical protein